MPIIELGEFRRSYLGYSPPYQWYWEKWRHLQGGGQVPARDRENLVADYGQCSYWQSECWCQSNSPATGSEWKADIRQSDPSREPTTGIDINSVVVIKSGWDRTEVV